MLVDSGEVRVAFPRQGDNTRIAKVSGIELYRGAEVDHWTSGDIAGVNVAARGLTAELADGFRVSGSGSDISGTNDEFRYVYTMETGDMDITVRTTWLNLTTGAKAGLMVRGSEWRDAANVAVLWRADAQVAQQVRTTNGGTTSTTLSGSTGIPTSNPVWLRISKTGNTFTTSYSLDGTTFTTVGSPQTVFLGNYFLIGLPVTSGSDGNFAEAVFNNVTVVRR
jgi:hypothetical protein